MMAAFQAYQAAFTAHLRHPATHAPPEGLSRPAGSAQGMQVYREIVFNNFLASVSACFPVLSSILGKRRFRTLVRQCFFFQHFKSPLFKDIPGSFVDFLQSLELPALGLPGYTAQLAHYEWIELDLAKQVESVPALAETTLEPDTWMHRVVRLTSVHHLLRYDFAVHQLSAKNSSSVPADTFLLAYRTPEFQIKFIQLNAVTYQLLHQLQTHEASAHSHLQHLAQTMPHLALNAVMDFGRQTLHTLHLQGVITVHPTL